MHLPQEQTKIFQGERLLNSKFYVTVPEQGTFLYSAFLDIDLLEQNEDNFPFLKNKTLIIVAWQNVTSVRQIFCCCIFTSNKTIITQDVIKCDRNGHAQLLAMRFECLYGERYREVIGVSLTTQNRPCSKNIQHYITPTIRNSHLHRGKIAMCNDLLYGTVNPKLIVEWFEIHRYLGVDKFTIHQDRSLNVLARDVLQYYVQEGLLEVLDFESPLRDTVTKRIHAETLPKYQRRSESEQMWNDELLAIYDCRERHKFYEFAVDIDLDEILVTKTVEINALKTLLTDLFRENKIAVLSFYVNLHFTSGKSKNATHPMLLGRYQDATQTVDDRVKNIYMPSRVDAGKGMIHKLYPLQGFSREYIDPSRATLHHFRECKTTTPFSVLAYVNGTIERISITCDSFKKSNSTAIKQLSSVNSIPNNMSKVFKALGL